MKTKAFLLTLTFSCFSLFGSVEKSIIPFMDQLIIKEFNEKINTSQMNQIEALLPILDQRLRVMSFNMLLNWSESHLEPVDRWETRKSRVIEYVQWAHPDVIGSQELQTDQLDDLLSAISREYDYYGVGADDGVKEGDIPAVFYRKDRLQLIKGETFYFSETPEVISKNPFGGKNTFTFCHFLDKKTGSEFFILNTHLAFGNMNRRHYEACKLRDFLMEKKFQLPVFITGDFNTFSFRQELDLPFFDGDHIVQTIENGGVIDSAKLPIFGHFGPISSTNFCTEKKKPFCSQGEPGIILDHVFVSNGIQVLLHGIDSAKVDGHFPSDHFPVIIDAIVQ
jgi:endonuclease/exonuclease/phosphatase family metal-dependent hydrolase